MSVCRSCQAEIIWAVTKTGARMPLDAAPVPGEPRQHGVFMLARRLDDDPLAWPVAVTERDGEFARLKLALYVSHFATCPHAAQHRGKPT